VVNQDAQSKTTNTNIFTTISRKIGSFSEVSATKSNLGWFTCSMNAMKNLSRIGLLILALVAMFYSSQAQKNDMDQTVYPFAVQDIMGKPVAMEAFKGKTLLIVNVASECGYTPQYEHLQAIYEKYKDQGLVVLGFPANDFGAQEPGTNAEILTFCSTRFGVNFPMFSKITVKGEGQHPLYHFLTTKELNGLSDEPVKWNFQKFLISKEGKLIAVIKPGTSVADDEALELIEKALK
jgi:glutathione peroxidase